MPLRTEKKKRVQGSGRWEALRVELPRALRRILGMPDYGAYVEHCRRAGHAPPAAERDYLRDFFERRGRPDRCC
jgi:uncharacterized short protein YbdD (DUF466 family)